jgi:predicted N-acetyltransferase YhbS
MNAQADLTPRPPDPGEFAALHRLLDATFRSSGGCMANDYPRMLCERNRANLRVCVDGDRVVSHVGTVLRDASLEGTPVRVALVGAVATDAEFRGQGLASKCLHAAMARAVECGADLMWISGSRGLYHRIGARSVGEDVEHVLGTDDVKTFARDLEVRDLSPDHILETAELYAHEAVRYIRPLEDWTSAFDWHFAFNGTCRFLGAWDSGRLAAYMVLHGPDEEGVAFVAEYAGARGVLLSTLHKMLSMTKASALRLHLGHHDRTLGHRLAAAGLQGKRVAASGTCVVLNFGAFMEKLRNRFAERAGEAAGSELSFAEDGPAFGPDNRFSVACGPDTLTIEGRGALAEFLFAVPDCREPEGEKSATCSCIRHWGQGGPFRAALPVPPLWYGLNYI